MRVIFILLCILWSTSKSQTIISPRATDGTKSVYFNFIVNCHDFTQAQHSYATILRLLNIFKKYNVKADFYFSEPLVKEFQSNYPDIFDSIKAAGIGIGIHHRPPHPLQFNGSIENDLGNMEWDKAIPHISNFESRQLNTIWGDTVNAVSGGFPFIENALGKAPAVIATSGAQHKILSREANYVLKTMGAKSIMLFHESGSDTTYPFFWSQGLMVRPVDFSITRWKAGTQNTTQFWWNMIETANELYYSPVNYLSQQLQVLNNTNLTFINSIMHENDFYYNAPSWKPVYYYDSLATQEKSPPFDLNAQASWAFLINQSKQDTIWAWYEALVKYVSEHPNIITYTMEDLYKCIADDKERYITSLHLKEIADTITKNFPNQLFPRFFIVGDNYFSFSDAFYALNYSLYNYLLKNELPDSFKLKDIMGCTDTVSKNLSTSTIIQAADLFKAVQEVDSFFNHYLQINNYNGRIPYEIQVGQKYLNPLEYLYLLASEYKELLLTAIPADVIPFSIKYSQTAFYNEPEKWTEKPARRINFLSSLIYPITSTEKNKAKFKTSLIMYPNPTKGNITLQWDKLYSNEDINIQIFSINEELIKEVKTKLASVNIDLTAFSRGVYFAKISTNTITQYKKIILN